MDKSQDKTVVLTPQSGASENPQLGNALPIGYVLQGTYVIEAQLGAGGFGITYLAKHRYLDDMWVAIKEYLPEGAAVRDESSRVHPISERHDKIYSWGLHRFLDEARLLRQFQHPNIVSVENFFEANETAYMVMNFVRGKSIQAELDSGRRFSEQELRDIIYQLMDALNTIHRHGLYHRDISPDNILLREEDGAPVLIDFGSARYEMRMHGAEQSGEGQAHTPTTIFKQGYSPIEQYEGTKQGPYTDIYAFGATLYRTAFGTRPVDSLKRSGELRLTQTDPLIPAKEQGKGAFSPDFLATIDAALQLDPASRPQTIDAWLANLHDVEAHSAEGRPARRDTRRRGWPAIALAALVVVGVAVAGFYWFAQRDQTPPLPTDIAALLARANTEIEAEPFDVDRQQNARQLFLQALNLDGFNTQALAGLSAANLLQDFAAAVEQENRDEGVVLLDQIETEFRRAGIDVEILETGWKQLELINRLNSLRETLPQAPLTAETWAATEKLISKIRALPGGASYADSTEKALESLQAARESAAKNQFDDARANVSRAEQLVAGLGVPGLERAYAAIAEKQQEFETARLAQIAALLDEADQAILSDPLRRDAIEKAIEAYDQVLRLDDTHSRAQAKRTFSVKLLSAYEDIEAERFDDARDNLLSAVKVAANAGLPTLPTDRADAFLQASERDWTLAQIRNQVNGLLTKGAQQLEQSPMVLESNRLAQTAFLEALELCGSDAALEAERLTAESGRKLADAMQEVAQSLEDSQFAAARSKLSVPQIAEWAKDIGLGPVIVPVANKTIDEKEITWLAEQAVALLESKGVLEAETFDQARAHTQQLLELAPEHAQAKHLAAGISALDGMQVARQNKDFSTATAMLKQALGQLDAAGVDTTALSGTSRMIARQEETWNRQQREQRIAALLQQAFAILAERPLDEKAHAAATRAFNAIAELDGGGEHAAAGQGVLSLLQDARRAVDNNDFDGASRAVDEAERSLDELSGYRLDAARAVIAEQQRAWTDTQATMLDRLIDSVAGVLNEPQLDTERLARIKEAYQEIAGLHRGADLSAAGLQLVNLLEQALSALADNDFTTFEEQLNAARGQLQDAGLQGSALETVNAQGELQHERWRKIQLVAQINALLDSATTDINAAPLDGKVLQQAAETYGKAMQLNEGLSAEQSLSGPITAGLESVLMLQAFAAELSDRQFEALKKTIAHLRERLPDSRLNGSLLTDLQQAADSAETNWHFDQAAALLADVTWVRNRNLAPLTAHIDQAAGIAPEDTRIPLWQQGIRILNGSVAASSERRFDEAIDLLEQAAATFSQLGVSTKILSQFGATIAKQRDRWIALSVEREIVAWTGAAVAAMNAAPFAERTWDEVDSLLKKIFAARPGDERGVTLQSSLDSLRKAAVALQSDAFAQADERILEARRALKSIGLANPLQRALDLVASQRRQQYAGQTESAITLLRQRPANDDSLDQALARLQTAARFDATNPVMHASAEILQTIQRARAADQARRYSEASRHLSEAQQRFVGLPPDEEPLPALRELLQNTNQLVTQHRPTPGEIYPIISVGLRKIASAPLDGANLDAAETLLRNALGLQADEQSALNGLHAIEQLRLVNDAIEAGSVDRARAQLLEAQQSLANIGLRESTLQAAWQQIEGMDQESTKTPD